MSLSTLDAAWYLVINHLTRGTVGWHPVLADYALWGGPVLLTALLVVAWWRGRDRGPATVAVVALTGLGVAVALLACQDLLSELIARPRPCASFPDAQVLLACNPDFSMPSDHAVLAGAIAAGLWLTHRGLAAVSTALAVTLAFARVYVGVHYPADTIVGLALGAATTLVVVWLLHRTATRAAVALTRTRLAWTVTTSRGPHPRIGGQPTESPERVGVNDR